MTVAECSARFESESHVVLTGLLSPALLAALQAHIRGALQALFRGELRHRTPAIRALPAHAQHLLAELEDPLECFDALSHTCSKADLRALRRAVQRAAGNAVPEAIAEAMSQNAALTALVGGQVRLTLALLSVNLPGGRTPVMGLCLGIRIPAALAGLGFGCHCNQQAGITEDSSSHLTRMA